MDNKFANIKERVLYLIELHGDTRENFFKKIDMSYGNFKGIAKMTPLNSDAIANILSIYQDVNPEWLLTGKGGVHKTKNRESSCVSEPNHPYAVLCNKKNVGIPLIPIDAMAGFFQGEQQVLQHECDHYVVPAFREAEFLIPVKGSSMQPKYNSGDIVACKKLSLDNLFFQWNKVYVLDTSQGALIKRIRKGVDNEHIILVSDNPSYDPFELSVSQINSIALVIGVIRLE